MKKQELELQLRTEKEREEGEYRLGIDHRTRSSRCVTQHGKTQVTLWGSSSRKVIHQITKLFYT